MLVVICEDMTQHSQDLMDLCDRYASEHGYLMQTVSFSTPEKLFADPAARDADIVMLDIMMPTPEGSRPRGVETARRLRAEGYRGAIIFTTTSKDFYAEGYEIGAAHYLIKPLTYDAVSEALARAILLIARPERIITVPINRTQVPIAQSLIRYVEVFGHETLLHTDRETLRVLLPLKKILELLDGDPFLRCYRSYIINMDYVKSVQEDCFILDGDVKIPLPTRNRQLLKKDYYTYRLSRAL